MADIKSEEARSKNMAAIRNRDTKPEIIVRKALYKQGLRYRIAYNSITGKPDIFILKHNVAIYIHGCFWHRHPNCRYAYVPKSRTDFWEAKFRANQKRDLVVQDQLTKNNVRFCVIWECVIKRSWRDEVAMEQLVDDIVAFIESDISFKEFQ